MIDLKENERIDELHRKGYRIIQNAKKFCFGIDAVLLSDFAKAKENEIVFDIGTGTGIIPILMSAKTEGKRYFAIDVQAESVEMAKRSVLLNKLDNKIFVKHLDIKDVFSEFDKGSIDVITSNPPYMNMGGGIINEYDAKAIARHEILCSLEDIIKNTSLLIKDKGRFYMVHRPHRLCDIIHTLREYKLEPKIIRFVQPFIDREPNMVLIESVKNGGSFLKIMPNLIVYNEDKTYTEEINNIHYR